MTSLEVGNAIDISSEFEYKAFAVPNDADVEDVQKIIANALFKQQELSSLNQALVGYLAEQSFDQGVSQHLMIDHDTDVLGTNFAIAFKTGNPAVDPSFNDTEVVTDVGPSLTKTVALDPSSAIFYDSALVFNFSDGLTDNKVTQGDVTVVFDNSQDLSYNMFKAVNSEHGRSDGTKGLKVVDADNTNALLYEGNVTRGTNNVLVYETPFTNDLSANGYQVPVFVDACANAFIGAIKLEQAPADEKIQITNSVNNNDSTLVDGSGNTIETLQLTENQVIEQFGEVNFDGYLLDVSGNVGGGYSVDTNDVVTLDDSVILRNTTYMSTLADFSGVTHELHVTNGSVTINGTYYEIVDSLAKEFLSMSEYNTDGSISINSGNRVDASGNLTASLDITYDYEEGTGLPDNYYTTRDINFDVKCLLGRTDGSNNEWTNVIARDDDALLLENSGPTDNITLQSIDRDVSDNQVLLLLINQYKDLAEESDLLNGDVNGPTNSSVVDGFVEVDVTDVDLNLAPYNGSDLRVQLRAKNATDLTKSYMDGSLSRSGVGLLDFSGSYLVSSKQNLNIMGDRVYDYISLENSFEVEHKYYTNTDANSVDTLIRKVSMTCSDLSENAQTTSVILQQNELEFFSDASYSTPFTDLAIPSLDISYSIDGSLTIQNVHYEVRKFEKKITYYLRHKVLLGPYQNLRGNLGPITETTTRYALWNTVKNRYAPDHHLLNTNFKPSRVFSAENRNTNGSLVGTQQEGTELVTTFISTPEKLRGYVATLQVLQDSSWVDVSGANAEADLCFDQETVINVLSNGQMTLIVDVPKNLILDEYYYINLTNKDNTGIEGTVEGALYSAVDLSNSAWDLSGVMTALPLSTDTKLNLTLDVSYGDVDNNGQTEVFYKVKEGSTTIVELKSTSTILSTFKVLKNTHAKFQIVETGVVNETRYESASGLNTHTLVQGANMTFADDVMRNEEIVFTLLFDKVTASLYNTSITNYNFDDADMSINIVDTQNADTQNAAKARAVKLLRFRGLRDAIIVRTPSTMEFKVTKGSSTYTQSVQDIYLGQIYKIDNLSQLGPLGIVFTGRASMFNSDKIVPVNVTFGSYTVSDNRDPSFNATISTKEYEIYNLEDYDGVSFYASRVRVEENERFTLKIGVPDLKVYKTANGSTIIEDLSSATWAFSQEIVHADLLKGVVLNGTSIRITRITDTPLGHTVYINAPAPQFYVEAANFSGVSDVVFDPSGVTVDTKYLDYVVDQVNNYKPFTGVLGSNDLEVRLPASAPVLIGKRATGINVAIPIETNKLTLKLHAMDIDGIVLSHPSPYTIFDGVVRDFNGTNNSSDLAWKAVYNSVTGLVNNIEVRTRLTPNSLSVDNQVYNLLFGGVHIFALGDYNLRMQPGNRVYTSVYGHTYSYKSDTNMLELNLVRYDTAIGIDFDPDGTGSMFRSYIPIATDKYIAKVSVSNNNVLDDNEPFNFNTILNNVTISSLVWEEVETFKPNELQLSIVCLTKVGQDLLRILLAVNVDYPAKVLLCRHPDVFRVTGADGAVRFRINAHGRIVGLSAAFDTVTLYPRLENGNNVLNELFNYDITNMGGL
jgi:hypothetical protein